MRKFVALLTIEDEEALKRAMEENFYDKKYDLIRYALRVALENLPSFIAFSAKRKREKNNGITTPLYAGFNEKEEEKFLYLLREVNGIKKTTKSDLIKDLIYFLLERNKGGEAMATNELERLFFSKEVSIYPYPYIDGAPFLRVSVLPEEKKRLNEVKEALEKNSVATVKARIVVPPDIPSAKRYAQLLSPELNGGGEKEGTLYITTKKLLGLFSLEKEKPSLFFSEFFPDS